MQALRSTLVLLTAATTLAAALAVAAATPTDPPASPIEPAAVDTDRDGYVTLEELRAYREARRAAHAERRFARLDRDGDGRIAVAEWEAAWAQRVQRLDRDGDGRLTPADRPHRHGHCRCGSG